MSQDTQEQERERERQEEYRHASNGKARVSQAELDARVGRPAMSGSLDSHLILNSNVNQAWEAKKAAERAAREEYARQIRQQQPKR